MKILLFTNSHLPAIGGKEIVVHHLATQLRAKGHNVTVSGPAGWWRHRNVDLGYPVERTFSMPLIGRQKQWQLRTRHILNRSSYDIIHSHATHPCGYEAQKFLQDNANSTPQVVTPHGADIHKVEEINFGKRLDPVLDEKIRWLLQNCAMTTAISGSVRDSLLDAGATADKITMIANGVDVERMQAPSDFDIRAHLGVPADAHLFVSVGNYHPRKGHENLIDAVAKLHEQNCHLVIVGRTDDACIAYAKAAGVENSVTFAGSLPFPIPGQQNGPDYLVALLQSSLGYVSASMGEGTEGLSLALLEAMAASTCPIATSISGNRDVVHEGKNGFLVEPGSAAPLAEAMKAACDNPDRTRQLGQAARVSIDQQSWSAITDQYIELYQQVIQQQASRSTIV